MLLLCLTFQAGVLRAHPFDGDGSGPAREGSSNVQAYLYIEPFTCRVEFLVWLPTALEMFGMAQGSDLILPEEAKAQLVAKARAEAPSWCAVKVNGTAQVSEVTASTVLRGMPGRSDVLQPGEAVGVMDAMLGLTWECSAPPDIQTVEITWSKFSPQAQGIPVTVSYGPIFERGMVLNAAAPAGLWKNDGTLPAAKPLAPVPPLPEAPRLMLPLASVLWVVLVLAVAWVRGWLALKTPRTIAFSLVILTLGGLALSKVLRVQFAAPWSKPPPVTVEQAQPVLQALLRNTYRAFDQRDESAVYDVLARSIHGELLQRLYLQTAQALALEAQDGTRVKVSDLAVDLDGVTPLAGREGFTAHGQWTAFGRVGHWGHMHQRINRYKADLTVEPVQGEWKLTALVVHEEVRDFVKQP